MNALVYKTYMKDEIIPKTVIFASLFGLTIDSFKTANEHGKYPYRIHFYHGKNIVGHMDFVVDEMFGELYPSTDYPFLLFTPIGNVSGLYSSASHDNSFSYQLDLYDKDKVDSVSGLFEIRSRNNTNNSDDYFIAAHATAVKDTEEIADITTNCCASQVEFGVRTYHPFEEVTCGHFGDLYIYHRKIKDREEKRLTAISIPHSKIFENDATLSFADMESSYVLPKVGDIDGNIRFDLLNKEIMTHDPSFFDFIDQVRDRLTLPVYGGNISLYDRLASLSYQDDSLIFTFSRAKEVRGFKKENPLVKKYRRKK